MAIASSTYQTWAAWPGFVHVEERHTDSEGVVHFLSYTESDSEDRAAKMAANAERLATELADQEAAEIIND